MLLPRGIDDQRPALIAARSGRRVTYGEVRALVGAWREVMRTPEAKSLTFVFGGNDLSSVLAYIAAVSTGQACALLPAAMHADLQQQLIDSYRPDFIVGEAAPAGYSQVAHTPEAIAVWRKDAREAPICHADLALLLTTSGTTGSPKFVRLSMANIAANARSISEYLGLTANERAITSLPFEYSYGLSVLNSHLLAGASVVISEHSVLRPELWNDFDAHQCTSFAGVPFTFQMLDRLRLLERSFPKTLRTLTQAGGHLTPELTVKMHALATQHEARFFVMYGQTEATARMTYVPAERLADKLGSVGIAVPGGTIRVVNDGGTDLPIGEPGHVRYLGPNVMLGYAASRDDLAQGDVQNGVLDTGDLGKLDADGYLTIVGRTKRIAKLFGSRINLDEVEARVRVNGPAAVVSNDEVLLVFCQWTDVDKLKACENDLIAHYQLSARSFRLVSIDEIPLTSSGKPDYRRLLALGVP